MPLRFDVEEYLGTNSDGSRSDEFCYYCLKDGKYIVDISMWEMIDIWIKYTDKYNEYADTDYSPKELREILDKRLPTLNRWRQKQETSSLHHKMIQNIIVYINGHLTEVLNTDTLSSMSGLSKFHFRRVFRTATGENIGSYIQRLRMEHVAHLLISTDYTLKQIIEQTSYQTKYSIAKAFKKHFGISTSQYREKHRPNGENPATNIKPEIKVISPIKIFCIEVGEAYKNKLKYRLLWNKLLHHVNSMKQTHDMTSLSALAWTIRRLRLRRSAGSIWASPFAMILKRDRYRESCKFPEGDMPCSDIRGAILLYTKCTGAFMRNGFRKVNTIPKAHSALRCI